MTCGASRSKVGEPPSSATSTEPAAATASVPATDCIRRLHVFRRFRRRGVGWVSNFGLVRYFELEPRHLLRQAVRGEAIRASVIRNLQSAFCIPLRRLLLPRLLRLCLDSCPRYLQFPDDGTQLSHPARKETGGWLHRHLFLSLSGCNTFGSSLDEAVASAREAIELYVESLKAHGEEVPTDDRTLEYTLTLEASA